MHIFPFAKAFHSANDSMSFSFKQNFKLFNKVRIKRKFYLCETKRIYESLQHQTFPENPFQFT